MPKNEWKGRSEGRNVVKRIWYAGRACLLQLLIGGKKLSGGQAFDQKEEQEGSAAHQSVEYVYVFAVCF